MTTLRVTAFISGGDPPSPGDIVRRCYDEDPEEETFRHTLTEGEASLSIQDGRWHVSVVRRPHRLDLIQKARLNPWLDTRRFTTLRGPARVLESFVARVSKGLLPALPPSTSRLAIGAQGKLDVDDANAARQALMERVPGLPLQGEEEEIVFRYNRPCVERIESEDFRLNRVWIWRTEQTLLLTLTPGQVRHALALDIDVNTSVDRQQLEEAVREPVISTLGRLASEAYSGNHGGTD